MATFVLVHGSGSGGWVFREVARILRAAGHEVFTPTLTGIGERVHLAGPDVDLEMHIEDICNVLRYEDLSNIVLYGASYAGMVITGVADRERDRIAHLVYGDAFVPYDGESALDLMPDRRPAVAALLTAGEWLSEPMPGAAPRTTRYPLKIVVQPLSLRNGGGVGLPRTFIRATGASNPALALSVQRVVAAPGWQYRELPSGHVMAQEMPRELANLLVEAAQPAAT